MDMIKPTIDATSERLVSPVNSHNEWDPLEEIIVGRLEGATIPSDHPVVACNIPGMAARAQALVGIAGLHFKIGTFPGAAPDQFELPAGTANARNGQRRCGKHDWSIGQQGHTPIGNAHHQGRRAIMTRNHSLIGKAF